MTRREMIFLLGAVIGAAGALGISSLRPLSQQWSYAFWYSYNDQKAIAVKPDGKIEFGPAYTADTLRQLLDGLRSMRESPGDCHETGYRFPFGDSAANGVIRIYPGTAPPFQPPRLANSL